jgi:enoyl-CoA hydratase
VTQPLVSADHDGIRLLTLNRPDARNALSRGLVESLFEALCAADDDDGVSVVVLTGADPAFCAGVDLKEAARRGMDYFEVYESHNCVTRVGEMRTPVIGAVNGPAFTGGLEIALGCDFLIASERAIFGDTHAHVGILPGGGMTARLPQLVGGAMARRMSMTGEIVDARRAERIGLVTEVVAHADLLPRALELAAQIAAVPRTTMRGLKEIYQRGSAAVIEPGLAAEQLIAGSQAPAGDLDQAYRRVAERNRRHT